VYVGKEEGLRIAKEYCYFLAEQGQYQCKLCPFISRGQCVETHVLAKHLTKLYLYRSFSLLTLPSFFFRHGTVTGIYFCMMARKYYVKREEALN